MTKILQDFGKLKIQPEFISAVRENGKAYLLQDTTKNKETYTLRQIAYKGTKYTVLVDSHGNVENNGYKLVDYANDAVCLLRAIGETDENEERYK